MNSAGSYVDPKFLTGEDYTQGGYGHHSAAAADYYNQHSAVQYQSNYPVSGAAAAAVNSQHALNSAAYSREAAAAAMGYGGYYQNCGMSPHQQHAAAMQQMAAVSHLSPLVSSPGAPGTVGSGGSGSHMPGGSLVPVSSRSPDASPIPQLNNSSSSLTNNQQQQQQQQLQQQLVQQQQQQQQHMSGYPSPPPQQQQHLSGSMLPGSCGGGGGGGGSGGGGGGGGGVPSLGSCTPQPQLTPDGGMSSDCSDDEGSPQGSGHMPVVYPWMKKIHVAGAGTDTIEKKPYLHMYKNL